MYSHSMGSFGSLIYPVSSKYIINLITCIYRGSRAIDGTHFRMTLFSKALFCHDLVLVCISYRSIIFDVLSVSFPPFSAAWYNLYECFNTPPCVVCL